MNGLLGLNILGDRAFDQTALMAFVQQLQPAYCVVLNNTSLAAELMPYTHVICRFTPDDGLPDGGGAQFVDVRRASVPADASLYIPNEPSASAKLNQFILDAQAAAGSLKLCILNLATGNPEPADWNILAPCIENAVRRGDQIGVHEYFTGDPLTAPSFPYYVGRCFDAVQRFGGQWVITESGYAANFDPYKGWQTAISEPQYADKYAEIAPVYSQHHIGACVFSYPDWDGHGFGIENSLSVQSRLILLNQTYKVNPVNPSYPVGTSPAPKLIDVSAGLKLRSQPTTSGALVRVMTYREAVTVYAAPVEVANSYNWQRVIDSQNNAGWSANYVDGKPSWIDPIMADTPHFSVPIPFVSQNTPTAGKRNDCGPACALMLLRWSAVSKGLLDPTLFTVNDLSAHTSLATADNGLTLAEVSALLTGIGVKNTITRPLSTDVIAQQLQLGIPSLPLVNDLYLGGTGVGHYIVVVAVGERGFWVNDPDIRGANYYLETAALDMALKDVLEFNAYSYEGILAG